jgi:hypothetical protein
MHNGNTKVRFDMTMSTLLIVLLIVFLLGGGGWGYSRWRS